jgi:hypothetical protein
MNTQKQNKITTIKTEADVPDDFVMPPFIYSRFVESDEVRHKKYANNSLSEPQGDCYYASMTLKLKLFRLGAVRVRGGISSKFCLDRELSPYFEHCWVEANGLVYDWSQGKNNIMKKEDWYSMYEIKETEIGTGTFGRFKDETLGVKSKKQLHKLDRMDSKEALKIALQTNFK